MKEEEEEEDRRMCMYCTVQYCMYMRFLVFYCDSICEISIDKGRTYYQLFCNQRWYSLSLPSLFYYHTETIVHRPSVRPSSVR